MKLLFKIISCIALMLTVLPSFWVLAGAVQVDLYKMLMLIGTGLWFLDFRREKKDLSYNPLLFSYKH